MTISTISSVANFNGSGGTGPFQITFPFNQNSDIQVFKTGLLGNVTLLTEGAGYSLVRLTGNLGGNITTSIAVNPGEVLTAKRIMPLTQETSLPNGGDFFASTIEDAFDRVTMQIQQVSEGVSHVPQTFTSSISASTFGPDLATAVAVIGSGSVSLSVDSFMTVIDNLVIPVNIALTISKSGLLTVAAGKTLTINGPFFSMGAQVFAGPGTVTINNDGYVFGFTTDTGNSNSRGRLQVYSEIGTAPATAQKYPLGNDLVMVTQGSADMHLRTDALVMTSVTSVTAGAKTVIISANGTLGPKSLANVSTSMLSLPSTGVHLIVELGTANEEWISGANWSIVNGSQLTATFTKTHTQPFAITEERPAIFLETGRILFSGDGTNGQSVQFFDKNLNNVVAFPFDTTKTFPLNAVQVNQPLTGDISQNGKLVLRQAGVGSFIEAQHSDGSLAMQIRDADIKMVAPFTQPSLTASVPSYGPAITLDASLGGWFLVSPNNGTAFTINSPTNGVAGQILTIMIQNATGGALGALTWGANFRLGSAGAWTQPASGFNRTIQFMGYTNNKWIEISRTATDVSS